MQLTDDINVARKCAFLKDVNHGRNDWTTISNVLKCVVYSNQINVDH